MHCANMKIIICKFTYSVPVYSTTRTNAKKSALSESTSLNYYKVSKDVMNRMLPRVSCSFSVKLLKCLISLLMR